MKRHVLLASISAAALAVIPAAAFAQEVPGTTFTETVDINIVYDNAIDTTIDTHVDFDKGVGLFGEVALGGSIQIDAAAVAVSDTKQLLEDNSVVEFDDLFGDENDANRVNSFGVDGAGNIGVNVAAGGFNIQANVATIAAADSDDPGNGNNELDGWAEASTTSLQKSLNNFYTGGIDNVVSTDDIGGLGNIGVNAAAGAFNVQENVLTLASVSDSALAEASSGVIQVSMGNTGLIFFTDNEVDLGDISGQGNVGVNAAAGVGNMQHNSLTAAVGLANGNGNGNGNN